MENDAIIQLALDALSCSQKELALRLGISPTLISKWKKGEPIPSEWMEKLRSLAHIGERSPSVVLWTGSIDNADKWEALIHYMATMMLESAETGYHTEPLRNEAGTLCYDTLAILNDMGVAIPTVFPSVLDVDIDDPTMELWERIDDHPLSSLINDIYRSLNDVYGFYAAYLIDLLLDDNLDLEEGIAFDIESSLFALAAVKVKVTPEMAPKMRGLKRQIIRHYEEWLTTVKEAAFRANVPLRAELLDLVYQGHPELGHDAEAESLGVNASRLHPDIYMNELLVGMRMIHQVLPAILKKLDIDKEFVLDTRALRISRGDDAGDPSENQ